ncbi:transglutaminase N-terminal domain-containing protein [uncultured Friedmanniella sp.]|uniref:transglutaminase family protein n=1 Tax=uncultured Friedmanniella sp. TaxID=335381 RepID=UPI0035CA1E20
MRLSIDHSTGFRYATPVLSSYNEARMTPAATEHQTIWSSRVSIEPAAWSFTYNDYWGTRVTTFELHEPHERLTVHAQAVVDTRGDELSWDTDRRVAPSDLGWAALHDRGVIDKMAEYLTVNRRTSPSDELRALAAEVASQPPRLAGLDVCALVGRHLTYERGSTEVTSAAADVWDLGRGVCQDFSHVALGALRSIGLPARYVSGYLHPGPREPNTTVTGESHSWIEWWCGTWVAYDPTLGRRLTDSYVRVGHGRDYGDVAPLRGTYSGGASSMFVTVSLTELG